MFSTRRAISGQALSSWKTKEFQWLQRKDDMRSKYLVCIPSARQSAIPNDIQVRMYGYADYTLPYHPTSSSVL
ncbi:hypothetical protein TNCV_3046951 [Trichonephila clavipes]|nr:hypothetical protein TNCV_3046951 [Trichonephila clavipes]